MRIKKKLIASVLSCIMLVASSSSLIGVNAEITNPKPMIGQSWTEGRYCENPFDVLSYEDVLNVHKVEMDITATVPVNAEHDTIAGDVYIIDSWNARANIAFGPSNLDTDGKPLFGISGLGKKTVIFEREDHSAFFTSGSMEGTQIIITHYEQSEFSVDALRYYDGNGNLLGNNETPVEEDGYTVSDLISLKKYLLNSGDNAGLTTDKTDINKDGKVNVYDLILLKGILLGIAEPPKEDLPDGIRDISAIELVQEMKIGWNLGNTLDATASWITNPTPAQQETSWGNPITTKAMIDEIKKAGFNTVRIPVTWYPSTGSAPDYKISDAWMNRVQEVVDYVIDNDMYCILNTHHEGTWFMPQPQNQDMLVDRVSKMWTQIADRFKNYDDHLIFEGLNEPRTEGSTNQWNGGTMEERQVLNVVNDAFVQTIRNSSGNNKYRFLMVPTYAAGMYNSLLGFEVPDDDRVIVSVHNYFPYDFALNIKGTSEWGTDQEYRDVTALMDTLYSKFVSKGQAVVLGEFGAMNKNNESTRAKWGEYFISEARKKGITCVWWDNNAFSGDGENFGLFNRNTMSWEYPQLLSGLIKGSETTFQN